MEKLTVADAKQEKGLMKKIDQLPKKEQDKFVKTYVNAFNDQMEKGTSKSKSKEYAMRTAWDNVPEKYLEKPTKEHGPGKSKKPLAALRAAYEFDREFLVNAGEEVEESSLDDFIMWCEANNIEFTAEAEPEKIEFTPEEQEVLKGVTMGEIYKEDDKIVIKLIADEENFVEIEISEEDSLEEEQDEALEEVLDEGVV